MTPARSDHPVEQTYQTSARLFGVGGCLGALALAALTAVALRDIARHDVDRGLGMLLVVITLRWAMAVGLSRWDLHSTRALRTRWRREIARLLVRPRREHERGGGDLALAIEHAATEPSLERLKVAAGTSLLGLIIIFWAAGWLPLVITVALLALAVPLYQRAGRRSAAMATEFNARRAVLESRQLEVLLHAPELRSLGAVDYGVREIGAISTNEHSVALRAVRTALESSLVTEFLSGVSIGLVAMVVGFGLLDGRISLLRALIAVMITTDMFSHVRRFGVEFHRRDDAQSARTALTSSFADHVESPHDELVARRLMTRASTEPIDLTIQAGDRIVVRGPSGSGKTTLLRTLVGWEDPRGGEVSRRRDALGFVSAESSLFAGSLRDNLTLGRTIDDDHIRDLLGHLGLTGARFDELDDEVIMDERVVSAGERVRLVLARALLCAPSVLVLDDIAGVLDHATRQQVRSVLSSYASIAIVEASVDDPLELAPTQTIVIRS